MTATPATPVNTDHAEVIRILSGWGSTAQVIRAIAEINRARHKGMSVEVIDGPEVHVYGPGGEAVVSPGARRDTWEIRFPVLGGKVSAGLGHSIRQAAWTVEE